MSPSSSSTIVSSPARSKSRSFVAIDLRRSSTPTWHQACDQASQRRVIFSRPSTHRRPTAAASALRVLQLALAHLRLDVEDDVAAEAEYDALQS